jgi:pilus assembly protein Flp/PilA
MLSLIKRYVRDERGATATEYAMLIVFVALALVVAIQSFTTGLSTLFNTLGSTIGGVVVPNP